MTSYQVSLEQMSFVEGEMQSITAKVQSTLTDLDDGSKQHLAEWSTPARDTYNAAKAKWDAAAAQMATDLAAATSALQTIAEYYTEGEKYGIALWNE